MVKSKKMSKTSIAVIVLALLLVLSLVMGMTGAWFTSKNSVNVADNALQFGKVGVIGISAEGVKHERYDSAQSKFVTVNGEVMPGDKVTAGALTFKYDEAQAGTETAVYYVIYDGSKYYKINNTDHILVELGSTEAAPEIAKGATLTVNGQDLKVRLGSNESTDWYALDGVYDGSTKGTGTLAAPKHSWEIASENAANPQGQDLGEYTMKIGEVVYQDGAFTYKVAVIQKTNVDNADNAGVALTELKTTALVELAYLSLSANDPVSAFQTQI